jgi:hypothetical protein
MSVFIDWHIIYISLYKYCYHQLIDTYFSASDYITGATSKDATTKDTSPFSIEKSDFNNLFNRTIPLTLKHVTENQFRKLKFSVHGKGIIHIANMLSQDSGKEQKITSLLSESFFRIFNSSGRQDLNTKEEIFMLFHEMSQDVLHPLLSIVSENVKEILPFQQFSAVFLHQLLEDLISSRSELYNKESSVSSTELSEQEQQVIFYISGFVICALQKRLKRLKSDEKEALINGLKLMQLNKTNTESTVSAKFSVWTNKLDRGGLKIPSDDMFFLIREFENQFRKEVKETNLTQNALETTVLKETIMDKFMVKYYAERLVPGKFTISILERILSIFLTIRGNAIARKKKLELVKATEKKAMRKVLKEKSIK